eukprot:Gb_07447 [translate_table: standard]
MVLEELIGKNLSEDKDMELDTWKEVPRKGKSKTFDKAFLIKKTLNSKNPFEALADLDVQDLGSSDEASVIPVPLLRKENPVESVLVSRRDVMALDSSEGEEGVGKSSRFFKNNALTSLPVNTSNPLLGPLEDGSSKLSPEEMPFKANRSGPNQMDIDPEDLQETLGGRSLFQRTLLEHSESVERSVERQAFRDGVNRSTDPFISLPVSTSNPSPSSCSWSSIESSSFWSSDDSSLRDSFLDGKPIPKDNSDLLHLGKPNGVAERGDLSLKTLASTNCIGINLVKSQSASVEPFSSSSQVSAIVSVMDPVQSGGLLREEGQVQAAGDVVIRDSSQLHNPREESFVDAAKEAILIADQSRGFKLLLSDSDHIIIAQKNLTSARKNEVSSKTSSGFESSWRDRSNVLNDRSDHRIQKRKILGMDVGKKTLKKPGRPSLKQKREMEIKIGLDEGVQSKISNRFKIQGEDGLITK